MIHPTAVPGSAEGMSWGLLETLMNSALAEEQRTEDVLRERCSIPDHLLTARRFQEVHFAPPDAVAYGVVSEIKEFSLPDGAEMYQI